MPRLISLLRAAPGSTQAKAVVLLALGACLLGMGIAKGLEYVPVTYILPISESIPGRLYWNHSELPAKGDFVLVCPPADAPVVQDALQKGKLPLQKRVLPPFCEHNVRALGKVLAAVEGDVVETTAQGVRVNGQLVANSKPKPTALDGRVLPHYPFGRHIVRKNEAWVVSHYHPDSFDSRYFGPVRHNSLVKMTPLF